MSKLLEITKLSELLELALADLEAVKELPGYKINMATYYHQDDNVCEICLAGACIVNQGFVHDWVHSSGSYRHGLKDRMFAISHAVYGRVSESLGDDLGMPGNHYHLDRGAVDYGNPDWNGYMLGIIKDLKEAGL